MAQAGVNSEDRHGWAMRLFSGYRSLLMMSLMFLCTGILCAQPKDGEVRIGRVSKLQTSEVLQAAEPFMKYLDSKVPGASFRIVHLHSDDEAIQAATRGDVDFLYVTPSVFVQLEVQSGAMVIATAKRIHGPGAVLKYVGGVIFTGSKRRDIATLADLRKKRVMGLNPLALGGWISAAREFDLEGLDPKRDFSELRFGANPEAVAQAVLNGDVDAGVLSISEFPQICRSPGFSSSQFKVLPVRQLYPGLRGLPVPASTRLYPGTAFVKMPHVNDELAERVAAALFEMPENGKVAGSMLVAGWTLPANYQTVHECLRQLRLPPYENFGKVTFWGAVGQHWQRVTLFLVILLGALTVAMVAALRLNAKLLGSQAAMQKQVEQLQQAEQTLSYQARLLAQTRDAVVAADPEYRVTFWNEAAEKLYGFASSEAIGRRIEELIPSFSGSGTREEIRSQVETAGAWSGDISFTNRQGHQVFAELAITRIKDSEGRTAGSVSGIRDMTERKRLEEELLQSQKMQAIGLLAGGVAHDFNNLLTVINGYAQLAMERTDYDTNIDECLAEVLKAGTRASELTQQLLAFGRKQVLQPQILNLNRLVGEAERLLRRLIGEDISLLVTLDPAAGSIKADPGQIQQVIMNLAVNARDALPKGGKLILRTSTAEFGPGKSPAHAEIAPGRYALLTVEDNGTGMDESTQSRIFEPFFTTKEIGKGTGLGLSTVYGIVRQSDGYMRVSSEVGKGTKFTVYLPEVASEAAPLAVPRETPARNGRGKLFIVEDQREVRELACRVLRSCGYKVTEASNGEEALKQYAASPVPIDLLVTDVVMPGMTGPELAARLRAQNPALRVLFVSGYSGMDSAQKALCGADSVSLQKPFLPDTLAQKVQEILGPQA